jgi:NAD(P)-dependent dehydrogenase (short-subunit alcohol dehydrogenase family)
MDFGLQGKAALVTGGSRGIGKGIARALAREGAAVAICARHEDDAKAAAAEIARETGANVVAFRADTGVADNVTKLVADAATALGGLDILVNNAARVGGSGGPDSLTQLNEPMLLEDFNVKIMGYLRCAHLAVQHMESKHWGRIVNIDGMAARHAAGVSGGMRNAAVANITKSLSEELGPKGITANVVHPATTLTDIQIERVRARAAERGVTTEEIEAEMAQGIAIRRLVTVEEIGATVAFLCSEQAACITGESLSVSGGSFKGVSY